MPLGSSSAAPVINPGPSRRRKWICFRGKPARGAAVFAFPNEFVTQLSQNRDSRTPPAPAEQDFSFSSVQRQTVPGRRGAQSLQELYASRKLRKISDSR